MAKTSNIVRFNKKLKYTMRYVNICNLCGRSKGYLRRFGLCRICFRIKAHRGELPGVTKASW